MHDTRHHPGQHHPEQYGEVVTAGDHAAHLDHGSHGSHPSHPSHPSHGGHGVDHSGHAALFRRLFWWDLVLAVPVIAFSEMVQDWLGYHLRPPGAALIPPLLGSVIFAVGGRPFLSGARAEVRDRAPGMMLLIAMAITVAFAASLASTIGIGELDFWWELAALIVVMLLGHWLEMRAVGQASGALAALAALLPDRAERVLDDGTVEDVAVERLSVGDVVLVRPGGRIPADGTIVAGDASLDESMLTGESRPVHRSTGARVVAGAVSTDSSLRVRVDATGDGTVLAGIARLVADAQRSRSRAQALADRAARALFGLATASALAALIGWTIAGSPADGVVAAVTVLVIACPHALGLAIPLVIALSTSVSARAGILVRDRLALERMRRVDTVVFDKTGTLTLGRLTVTGIAAIPGVSDDDVLRTAASAEASSEHPIARAIVRAGAELGAVPVAGGSRALPGRGVTATVHGATVAVGGPALLRELALREPDGLRVRTDAWRDAGDAVLHVVRDGRVIGALTVADAIRPESYRAVRTLHERGIEVVMLTGDARQVAHAVGGELGIDEVFAEVQPADKERTVAELQARGRRVAMVGDGVNDAPALARADVGIAIGAGTDVAIESAGVVLASDDPRGVIGVIELSRAGYRKMVQNLVWATGYNLASLPVAAGVFAFAGLSIPPALAAVTMSLSTIVVAANAQLLRRLDLRPDRLA